MKQGTHLLAPTSCLWAPVQSHETPPEMPAVGTDRQDTAPCRLPGHLEARFVPHPALLVHCNSNSPRAKGTWSLTACDLHTGSLGVCIRTSALWTGASECVQLAVGNSSNPVVHTVWLGSIPSPHKPSTPGFWATVPTSLGFSIPHL